MREAWLDQLEATLAEADLATALVTVAAVAGQEVELDDEELRGAARRALFTLAAGGDPDRGLDLNGPAVTAFARDLDESTRRAALTSGLERLHGAAVGFPHASEAVRALLDDAEIAWRSFACALLAEELAHG